MKRSELPAATLLILVTMLLATHSHSTAAEKSHVCSSRVVPSLGIQFSSYAGKLKQQRIVVASPPNRFERVKEQDEFANSIVRYLGGVRGKSVHRAPQVLCAHRSPFASGQSVLRRLLPFPRFPSRTCCLGNRWMTSPQSARL